MASRFKSKAEEERYVKKRLMDKYKWTEEDLKNVRGAAPWEESRIREIRDLIVAKLKKQQQVTQKSKKSNNILSSWRDLLEAAGLSPSIEKPKTKKTSAEKIENIKRHRELLSLKVPERSITAERLRKYNSLSPKRLAKKLIELNAAYNKRSSSAPLKERKLEVERALAAEGLSINMLGQKSRARGDVSEAIRIAKAKHHAMTEKETKEQRVEQQKLTALAQMKLNYLASQTDVLEENKNHLDDEDVKLQGVRKIGDEKYAQALRGAIKRRLAKLKKASKGKNNTRNRLKEEVRKINPALVDYLRTFKKGDAWRSPQSLANSAERRMKKKTKKATSSSSAEVRKYISNITGLDPSCLSIKSDCLVGYKLPELEHKHDTETANFTQSKPSFSSKSRASSRSSRHSSRSRSRSSRHSSRSRSGSRSGSRSPRNELESNSF